MMKRKKYSNLYTFDQYDAINDQVLFWRRKQNKTNQDKKQKQNKTKPSTLHTFEPLTICMIRYSCCCYCFDVVSLLLLLLLLLLWCYYCYCCCFLFESNLKYKQSSPVSVNNMRKSNSNVKNQRNVYLHCTQRTFHYKWLLRSLRCVYFSSTLMHLVLNFCRR